MWIYCAVWALWAKKKLTRQVKKEVRITKEDYIAQKRDNEDVFASANILDQLTQFSE
jgi:hypothetical protein